MTGSPLVGQVQKERKTATVDTNKDNNVTKGGSLMNDKDTKTDTNNTGFELGGVSSVPCYCLLDGFFNDPDSGEKSRVTIPITKLPATLGRSHDSDDAHFFGLGKKKALSRKQCRIGYRDAQGGKVEWNATKQELVYMDPSGDTEEEHATMTSKNQDLPPNGFFVIENLGKNRIMVNQGRVEQGTAAVLKSGSSVRVSSYTLYFLRPVDTKPTEHIILTQTPHKKRKIPDTVTSSNKRSRVSQHDFDSLPVEHLLEQMNDAIEKALWERRHQLIGASIALHAIRDAARDPEIQTVALNGGVSRSEIMAWVEESPKYSNWVTQMLLKMEPRSYQAAITKCLLRAGFTRTSSSGRYIKWYLPKDTTIVVSNTPKKGNPKESKEKGEKREEKDKKGQHEENDEEREEDDEEGMDDDDNDHGDGDEKSGVDLNDNDNHDDNDEEGEHDEDQDDEADDRDIGDDESNGDKLEGDNSDDEQEQLSRSSGSDLDRTRPYSSATGNKSAAPANDDDDDDDDDNDNDDKDVNL